MKTIVITGSTRGIGRALAESLLARDHQVVVSGRSEKSTKNAIKEISISFPNGKVIGFPCRVNHFEEVQALWDETKNHFGNIDIWVNNAGISNQQNPVWEIPVDEIRCVIETNLIGEILGTRVALSGFLDQGYGAVYNLEGMGAKGRTRVKGLSIYGATKSGIRYFNDAVPAEIENPGVILCALQPGMVLTDMVTGQYVNHPQEWERVKGVLGLISEDVHRVAEWMAEKILTNKKNGRRFRYGGYFKIMTRMIRKGFGA
jgi:NAD(P)-dependent dehydrogenase (short-subunit alcohol dehydrogenase family)